MGIALLGIIIPLREDQGIFHLQFLRLCSLRTGYPWTQRKCGPEEKYWKFWAPFSGWALHCLAVIMKTFSSPLQSVSSITETGSWSSVEFDKIYSTRTSSMHRSKLSLGFSKVSKLNLRFMAAKLLHWRKLHLITVPTQHSLPENAFQIALLSSSLTCFSIFE